MNYNELLKQVRSLKIKETRDEQPSDQAKKYAEPHGGVRKGQMLYCLSSGEVSHCALLWLWSGGQATTIKLYKINN